MSTSPTAVRVVPGDGLVSRVDNGVLVVVGSVTEEPLTALLTMLRECCENQPTPGRVLARRIAQYLFQADPSTVPAFGSLAPTAEGWAVTLHGDIELHVSGGANEGLFSGRDVATWLDRIIPEGFERLSIGRQAATLEPLPVPFGLLGGVVPGGGVVLGKAEARPPKVAAEPAATATHDTSTASTAASPRATSVAPSPPVAPAGPAEHKEPLAPPPIAPVPTTPTAGAPKDEPTAPQPGVPLPPPDQAEHETPPPRPSTPPAPERPFKAISLLRVTDVPSREPLAVLSEAVTDADIAPIAPLVKGVLCRNGHFNHPQSRYCSVDGISMVHRTLAPVQRPRPPLGVLVGDDGSAYPVDQNYLVGREAEHDDRVTSGAFVPLQLEDAERSVSRVHAEIVLQDWDVTVIDCGSANGTYLAGREDTEWRRLAAGQPGNVAPGTRIAFGKRVMTFDSHHQT